MSPVSQIALLWLAFAGSHVLLSSRALRPRITGRIGERAFLGLYSLLSLALFVPLVSIYLDHRHEGAFLWTVSMTPVVTWLVYALMTVGILLVVAGLVAPAPTSLLGERGAPPVHGMVRITRHPLIMGFGWIGLVHLIPNASPTDVAFFAGLPAFAVLGCRHQEQRMRESRGPEFAAFLAATPFLPFTGRETLRGLRELPAWLWIVAVAASAAIRWAHGPLFH
ncbi:MAG: hypothetical protein HKP30_13685 [Myxococcales bacterium]|nr:hypothetical protein [Myxococcales bacterium]